MAKHRQTKFTELPEPIKRTLILNLIEGGKSLTALADWLKSQNHPISISNLRGYGLDITARLNHLKPLALKLNLSNSTIAKRFEDLEIMNELQAKKLIIDDQLNALEQSILATERNQEAKHETQDNTTGNN